MGKVGGQRSWGWAGLGLAAPCRAAACSKRRLRAGRGGGLGAAPTKPGSDPPPSRRWGSVAEPGARGMSAPDERHGFLESFATLLLRLRPDKWSKFEGSEDARAVLDEFFRQPDMLELLLSLNPAGQLQPSTCFLPTLKGKGIYFVKRKKENITRENCQAALLVGDISPWPVEQLIVVVEEVGRPHGPRPPGLPCRGAAVASTRGGLEKQPKEMG